MRYMKITYILLFMLFFIIGCDEEKKEKKDNTEFTLLPGKGISSLNLNLSVGDNLSQLNNKFTKSSKQRTIDSLEKYISYSIYNISILAQGEAGKEIVKSISIYPGFNGQTESGLKIGSSKDSVKKLFGEPEKEPFMDSWSYKSKGIGFVFGDNKVIQIKIWSN